MLGFIAYLSVLGFIAYLSVLGFIAYLSVLGFYTGEIPVEFGPICLCRVFLQLMRCKRY